MGGVFSITAVPAPDRCIGRCIASAWRRPRLRLARAAALAPGPARPRVRGRLDVEGALAKGISTVEREVDGIAIMEDSGPSADGAET